MDFAETAGDAIFFVDINSFHHFLLLSSDFSTVTPTSGGILRCAQNDVIPPRERPGAVRSCFSRGLDAQDFQLDFVEADAAQMIAVAAQALDGVDTHTAEHLFDLK